MSYPPSPQQSAAYKWVKDERGNLILVAVAGAGKTTTVLNMATMMQGSVAYCAYNKKIADEIAAKLRAANVPNRIQAGTFHSFGFRNWRKLAPEVKVDGNKVPKLVEDCKVQEWLQEFTVKLVSMAKQRAFGVLTPIKDWNEWRQVVDHYSLDECLPEDKLSYNSDSVIDEGIATAMVILQKSIELDKQVIDFDDMIYAPLIHDCRVWQNDWICVDEAQDTNPSRRALAKKMLRPGGRAVFVGDPAQAIYGFTGADNDSLEIIEREFSCKRLPLTVTYRCPKRVVEMARNWVSHITAADSAPEGSVSVIDDQDFAKLNAEWFTADAVMLCRNTAPLVANAYGLIRRGIACHVEGKSIGAGLLNLINKWKTNNIEVLQRKMSEHLRRETEKFLAKGQEQKAEALTDKVETVNVIIDALPAGADVGALRIQVRNLFGDTPEGARPRCFTLSTVHKAKGREWKTVYLYDRASLMPSRFARQAWQMQQEDNLIYVAVTRAQENLIEVRRTM